VKNEDVSLVEEVQEEVKEEEAPAEVFVVVEEMPTFPGGEKSLMEFIYANIQYPDIAKENNIQGRVILKFCVTYKGGVDQVQVLKGVDPSLDNEAIRVIKLLPAWKPGKQGGKPVNVWYNVPVTFQLK
jgi:protein TonB